MQAERAEGVQFPTSTIDYIDRISKSVLGTTLPDGIGMSSSAFVCAVNAAQVGYPTFKNVGGTPTAGASSQRLGRKSCGGRAPACCRSSRPEGGAWRCSGWCRASLAGGGWPTAQGAVAENVSAPIRFCSVGVVNSGSAQGVLLASPVGGHPAL